jgi:hypothetical protein
LPGLDVVELGLEVLEREREVEDFDVSATRFGDRSRDERRHRRGPAERGGAERAAQDEARARHAMDLGRGELARAGQGFG